jgi:signal transduction histidine kinase
MHRQLRFLLILGLALIVGAGMIFVVLQPPQHEWPLFGLLLFVPAGMAVVSSTIARKQGWWRRFGSVTTALVFTCALGAGMIFVTLLITTGLMFISAHDASLTIVIVLFAAAVSMAFGYLVASSLSDGIGDIARAAKAVQSGDLSARADDGGKDEIARLARAFNEMTAQLQHVRDQEAKLDQMRRDLIAWVSHDLRTPLTGIRARVEALADGVVQEPAEVQRYLATIQNDTQALNRLIDDLFELATIDAGGLKLNKIPVDMADLISDTIETMSVIAKNKGVVLNGDVAANLGLVVVSPQHIQRVLNNLISNALAHTPQGEVKVRAFRLPKQVCFEVNDTGEGIRPQDVPHVFDRFYRGERARTRGASSSGNVKGMGLGLAIARALVEAHNGAISLSSDLGKGTRVKVVLPV